jgi:hypothetical protein
VSGSNLSGPRKEISAQGKFSLKEKTTVKIQKVCVAVTLFAAPLVCSAETWKDVSIVDVNCSAKVKANPDAHTRDCAMQCAKSGYGLVTADGTYLKFDSHGNEAALTALKKSQAKDHLRATVTGEREGDTIKVNSLKL